MPQHVLDLKKNKIIEEGEAYISWEAEEYDHIPKGQWWFIALITIILALVVGAIILQNYFFAAFIAIAGVLTSWFAAAQPRKIGFSISQDGIRLDNKLYHFEDLRSFWIFYDPPLFKELSLESKKVFMPHIRAPLGETDPNKVRWVLAKFLPEKKQEEPFISIISRVLRF